MLQKANPNNLPTDKPQKQHDETSYLNDENYKEYKALYEQKIAANFGLSTGYRFTKEWSQLIQNSFKLADTFAKLDYMFEQNRKKSQELENDLAYIDQKLLDRKMFLASTPTLMPTRGWITSYYGPRISPYSGRLKMHEGLDLGAKPGTPIFAPADGIVIYSGTKPGFGNTLSIDHGYGLETIYAHARSLKVKKGKYLKRGDLIAEVGNTGYSTGPHLHYEIRINGIPIDPLFYILD
jgi:murein DD-endopeptidase MepM/ murein hydrolase activator NlpD